MAQNVTTIAGPNSGINDALIVDSLGNIYGSDFGVSSTGGSSVYKIDTTGVITTFSTGYSSCNGLTFDHDGKLYVVDFTSAQQNHQVYKLDNLGNKTAYGPKVSGASGIIFDPNSDTLYISQYSGASNSISKLAPNGTVSLYCSHNQLNGPVGMAFDDSNNLYVANFTDGEIYKVTHGGDSLSFIAKVPNSGSWGIGFMIFANGYLYATAIGKHKIYEISTSGNMTEFAGTGNAGTTDGEAHLAEFNRPNGIATNWDQDKIYISDYTTKNIREITGIVSGTIEIPFSNISDFQNYPNPVMDKTTLTYQLKEQGNVRLDVYAIDGRTVYQNNFQNQKQGTNQFLWNTEGLNSGLYLITITSGEHSLSKKICIQH
jgi:sugar lactone lactonase YvrE